jgi:hypothetical protein
VIVIVVDSDLEDKDFLSGYRLFDSEDEHRPSGYPLSDSEDEHRHQSDNAPSHDDEDEDGHHSDNASSHDDEDEDGHQDDGQEEEVDRLADMDAAAVRLLGQPARTVGHSGRKKYVLKSRKPRATQGKREEATQSTLVNCIVTLSWF